MATSPLIFSPTAAQATSGVVSTQQYNVDWQNFLTLLNGFITALGGAFLPAVGPGTGGLLYVDPTGNPHVLNGQGLLNLLGGPSFATLSGSAAGVVAAGGAAVDDFGVTTSGAAGRVLTSNGPSVAPTFQSLKFTGLSDGIVESIGNVPGSVGFGSSGQILTSTGTGATWATSSTPRGISTQSGDLSGSQNTGTVYQNTNIPSSSRFVSVSVALASGALLFGHADGSNPPVATVAQVNNNTGGTAIFMLSFWVLPGNFYELTSTGTITITHWFEWN